MTFVGEMADELSLLSVDELEQAHRALNTKLINTNKHTIALGDKLIERRHVGWLRHICRFLVDAGDEMSGSYLGVFYREKTESNDEKRAMKRF